MKPTVKLAVALVSIYAAFWHFAPRSIHAKSSPAWSFVPLIQQQKLTAGDAASVDQFGRVVALSGDTAIVGAFAEDNTQGNNAGAAYVFVRTGGIWTQQQKLIASDGAASDNFGFSVAIEGDTALIGAVQANNSAGVNAGAVYVFTRSNGLWTQQQRLQASDVALNDLFGNAISLDGDTAVIGSDGDDDGGAQSGSSYVFTRSSGIWTQQQKLTASDAAAGDNFGESVAVDDTTVLIGARHDDHPGKMEAGSAYVFTRNGNTWTQQQKLTASDAAASDSFAFFIGLSGDTAIVGADGNDGNGNNAGAAYIFTRNNGVWTQQQRLHASDAAESDGFGAGVCLDGDVAVVGALIGNNLSGIDSGAAYVFTRSENVWIQQQKLVASDGAANDHFGLALALSGNTVIIGAADDDHPGATDAGSAYVFVPEIPNNPPIVDAGPDQSATEDVSFNLVASFTDADVNDTHTATINWGDGSPAQAATVTEPSGSNAGLLNASHTYLAAGSYQITVTVTDAANASASDTLQVIVNEPVSDNYIHNTTTPQANANFNISGNGVVGGNLTVNGMLQANGSALTDLNATNITTGTLDNARLGLISTPNIANSAITTPQIADSAVTVAKIGSNQVVKNLNGLTDSVNLQAGPNVSITPSGNTLTIAAAGGASQWISSGSNISYNSGNVGIGTASPTANLHVFGSEASDVFGGFGKDPLSGPALNVGYAGSTFGRGAGFFNIRPDASAVAPNPSLRFLTVNLERMIITNTGNVGIGTTSPTSKLHVVGDGRFTGSMSVDGSVQLNSLGTAGSIHLCRNAFNQIAACSSSLRYKTNIIPFSFGLGLVRRLRPVTFSWKADGTKDIGFGAEEVAAIEPLLVTYNANGEVEGVKYDRISALLVNAIKEQQAQIEAQQTELKRQQSLIDGMRKMLCRQKPKANICR